MKINLAWIMLLAIGNSSCDPNPDMNPPKETLGFIPVYSTDAKLKKISAEPPRITIKGGKIFTTGSLLFQVEPDSGIHVINYADPRHPQKLVFIRSFLCKEISVKNGFVYTNNFSDLVVIDITDMNKVHEVSRVEGVFPDLALQYPPKSQDVGPVYFECPDPGKGVIVAWKEQNIKHPKCWR
jgi:hypothetical protein